MTRRRKFALLSIGALGLAAAILALIYHYFSPHDPVIGELRFSDHLLRAYTPFPWNRQNRAPNSTELKQHQTNLSLRASSRRALRKAGPEVLPLITNWLATDTPSWKSNLQVRLQARGYDLPRLTANRRRIAWQFLAENPMEIGPRTLPFFATVVSKGSQEDLYYASQAMSRLDPQHLYRPLLILELGPAPERVGAAMNLADFPRFPERAIPLLMTNLSSTNRAVQQNCARALGKFGHQARPALPALTNLLHHPRDFVRLAASNAIASITQANGSPRPE